MDPMVLDNHFLTNCWRRRFRSGTVLSSALPLVALTVLCLAGRCLPLHGIGIGRIHNTGDSKINTDKIGVDELDEEINKRLILARTVRSHPYFIVSLILQYNWILKPPADRTTPSITSRLEYSTCTVVRYQISRSQDSDCTTYLGTEAAKFDSRNGSNRRAFPHGSFSAGRARSEKLLTAALIRSSTSLLANHQNHKSVS